MWLLLTFLAFAGGLPEAGPTVQERDIDPEFYPGKGYSRDGVPYTGVGHHKVYRASGPVVSVVHELVEGVRHGTAWGFHDSGAVDLVMEYEHGVQHGSWLRFDADGHLAVVGQMEDGERSGSWTEYFPSGAVRRELVYAPRPDGPVTTYFDSGGVAGRSFYENATPAGSWETFWRSGGPREVGAYEAGRQHGPWKLFWADGTLLRIEHFDHGKSLSVEWPVSWAQLLARLPPSPCDEHSHRRGLLVVDDPHEGSLHFCEELPWTGEVEQIARNATQRYTVVHGRMHGPWSSQPQRGKAKVSGQYEAGRKSGVWTRHDGSTGAVMETGSWRAGVEHGTWTAFWSAGVKRYQVAFVEGERVGPYVQWSRDGSQLRGRYVAGLQHGWWTRLRPDGSVEYRTKYRRGRMVKRRPRLDRE
jgi:antitoxin component YwqK of YwqJK toxin-antitoxin module